VATAVIAALLQPRGTVAVVAAASQNATAGPLGSGSTTSVQRQVQPGELTWMAIETPLPGATLPPAFMAAGYAFDRYATSGTGVDAVYLYAYPDFGSGAEAIFLGAATYGITRDDVARAYGSRFAPSGFELAVSGLPADDYRIVAFAHNVAANGFSAYVFADVTVAGFSVVSIDTPAASSTVTSSFEVGGWAIDNRATTGTGIDAVHVYLLPNDGADPPVFAGAASYGWTRGDVAAAYGARFADSGYHFTVSGVGPGNYVLNVYAHCTATDSFSLVAQRRFTVSATALLSIDGPAPESTIDGSPFSVTGWAIDRSAPSGTGVDALHVYAYRDPGSGQPAVFLGVAASGIARSDVAALYGSRFESSGYALNVDPAASGLAPGVYDIVVWAHSTASDAFVAAAVVRVRVR
jgi:hypothetical protein